MLSFFTDIAFFAAIGIWLGILTATVVRCFNEDF
jgi:hypothetical protein